jgi:PKD repeat protein
VLITYTWDFGDGGTGTGASPVHIYTDSGTYALKMTVTTKSGCTETLTFPAAVRTGPVPFVDFVADTNNACASGAIKFKSLAQPADRWIWILEMA